MKFTLRLLTSEKEKYSTLNIFIAIIINYQGTSEPSEKRIKRPETVSLLASAICLCISTTSKAAEKEEKNTPWHKSQSHSPR